MKNFPKEFFKVFLEFLKRGQEIIIRRLYLIYLKNQLRVGRCLILVGILRGPLGIILGGFLVGLLSCKSPIRL